MSKFYKTIIFLTIAVIVFSIIYAFIWISKQPKFEGDFEGFGGLAIFFIPLANLFFWGIILCILIMIKNLFIRNKNKTQKIELIFSIIILFCVALLMVLSKGKFAEAILYFYI